MYLRYPVERRKKPRFYPVSEFTSGNVAAVKLAQLGGSVIAVKLAQLGGNVSADKLTQLVRCP